MDQHRALTQYNVWANSRLLDLIGSHPAEYIDREMPGSFPTLRLTWYHIWDAETIWLKRLKGHSPDSWPSRDLPADFVGFEPYLLQTSEELRDLVCSQEPGWFSARCVYRTLDGKTHQTPNGVVVQHVTNHSTFHRGQVLTIMRHLGWSDFPSTDFIRWHRDREKDTLTAGELRDIYG